MKVPEAVADLPVPSRYALVGATSLGVPGFVVGLVVGLFAYAPTAWAAAFEVGLPATLLGAVLGLAVGSVVVLVRRL